MAFAWWIMACVVVDVVAAELDRVHGRIAGRFNSCRAAKYKQLRSIKRFKAWWIRILDREPGLFKHWAWKSNFLWKG